MPSLAVCFSLSASRLLLALCVVVAGVFSAPAAHAQPRIVEGDVPIEQGFSRQEVVSGLVHPWSFVFVPDGDVLVTERPGRLRRIVMNADGSGRLVATPVPGLPRVFAGGQGGLLDISLHPDFADNKLVYFTYAHGSADANRTRVARAIYDGSAIRDWEVLFEVNAAKSGTQHFGSRIAWLPDGTLLVSIGDGGNPPVELQGRYIREYAQDLGYTLGKVIRINDDGTVPDDNPFVGTEGAEPEIFSYGHRNIQGLVYDPTRGAIWASEHGALGGDELNRVRGGENYGWPLATFSREYFDGSPIAEAPVIPGTEAPKVVWLSAIAPSGLELYTGDAFPQWQGDLFAGALIKQSVRRIDLAPDGTVLGQTELRFGARVRAIEQGPDGLLYVITDEDDGRLIRVTPADGGDMAP